MRRLSYHRKMSRNFQDRDQHKLEPPSRNISVLWQNGTGIYQERDQDKLESPSRNISVLWQNKASIYHEGDQHKFESPSRNISVLWQKGTATSFGIYNVIKGGTSPLRRTDSSITSQTTLYWGAACITESGFQKIPRAICGNICSQSCEKQITSKFHACLNQSGMGFACDLLAGAAPLYHASRNNNRRMPKTVSRDALFV